MRGGLEVGRMYTWKKITICLTAVRQWSPLGRAYTGYTWSRLSFDGSCPWRLFLHSMIFDRWNRFRTKYVTYVSFVEVVSERVLNRSDDQLGKPAAESICTLTTYHSCPPARGVTHRSSKVLTRRVRIVDLGKHEIRQQPIACRYSFEHILLYLRFVLLHEKRPPRDLTQPDVSPLTTHAGFLTRLYTRYFLF